MKQFKILNLEVERTKRVKAVYLNLTQNGAFIMGGKNKQGKTSFLDALPMLLGGKAFMPDEVDNTDSEGYSYVKCVASNGWIIERKGKNHTLKITDPSGESLGGQALLDSVISKLALDLPKFMASTDKQKAKYLLSTIGVELELEDLETKEANIYDKRKAESIILKSKESALKALPQYKDVPSEPVSLVDLMEDYQEITKQNEDNQQKRNFTKTLEDKHTAYIHKIEDTKERIAIKEKELEALEIMLEQEDVKEGETRRKWQDYKEKVSKIVDGDLTEVSEKMKGISATNTKVNANIAYNNAENGMKASKKKHSSLDKKIKLIRDSITALLDGADLPLEGLTVKKGILLYKGMPWGNMSGIEQLQVAVAIIKRLKPECGFVLMDKMEQFDPEELQKFVTWVEYEGLQLIATRVSSGKECSIIIEDGMADNTIEDLL